MKSFCPFNRPLQKLVSVLCYVFLTTALYVIPFSVNAVVVAGPSSILIRHDGGIWYNYFFDDGVVTSHGYLGATPDLEWTYQASNDFNGDGNDDILLRHSSGYWYIYYLDADGRTIIGNRYLGTTTDLEWEYKGSDDFNNDGKADLLIRNSTNGYWFVYYFDDDTLITGGGYLGAIIDQDWEFQSSGDFNGDGQADILIRNNTSGYWFVYYLTNGAITGGGYMGMTGDLNWQFVSEGDMDGNGQADILIRNTSNGAWYLYSFNQGVITPSGYIGAITDTDWVYQTNKDLNGDGNADILIRHRDSSYWFVYYLNNNLIIGGGYIGLIADSSWSTR